MTCPTCGARHPFGVCCDPAVEDDEDPAVIRAID